MTGVFGVTFFVLDRGEMRVKLPLLAGQVRLPATW